MVYRAFVLINSYSTVADSPQFYHKQSSHDTFLNKHSNSYIFTEKYYLKLLFSKVAVLESTIAILLKLDSTTEFFSHGLFSEALLKFRKIFCEISIKYVSTDANTNAEISKLPYFSHITLCQSCL